MSAGLLECMAYGAEARSEVSFLSPAGHERTSFAALWDKSGRAQLGLLKASSGPSVAGIMTTSSDMAACMVGALRAGLEFVSLPLRGRAQPEAQYLQQIGQVLTMAGTRLVVAEAGMLPRLAPAGGHVRRIDPRELTESAPARAQDSLPGSLVQFSSGTTGVPKGVRLTASAIKASVAATLDALDVRAGDTICHWVPLSHDMGLVGGLFSAWIAAGRERGSRQPTGYHCMSPEMFLARPVTWMALCAEHGATHTMAPTFGYQLLVRHLAQAKPLDLGALRACVVGAEPIHPGTLSAFESAASVHRLRSDAICPAYGLAEATLTVSVVRPGQGWSTRRMGRPGAPESYTDFVVCGEVLDCLEVRTGCDRPPGTAGAIEIRGVARCSARLPRHTSLEPEAWLDTGDLGALVGKELVVTGRGDDLLCIAGRNLFAWEVERVAAHSQLVRPGCCIAVPDSNGGYAVLFESKLPHKVPDVEELAILRADIVRVAGLAPSTLACVPRGVLPKTPSGKAKRNDVLARLPEFLADVVVELKAC